MAEVLDPCIVQAAGEFHWLLADDFEDFVDPSKDVVIYDNARSQSLLDLGTLRGFAEFMKNIGGVLSALPHIAEQGDEEFFRISDSHNSAPAPEPSYAPPARVLSKLAGNRELFVT
jgi:hypothetical protein